MKKNLRKKSAIICAKVLKHFAVSTSASACNLSLYQPKEPECLRKDK
ncbi:cyclic lactone autoinducer peptide [Clostridium fermenticellae]|uniref:Cyclic lactone autoinducer peptide n=1 Tax=Clostridium fermenticellae TaxID=2068654 RepID=A0A386H0U5_9CLOT|nr:cyclic lactone autoinducer peptide [Clostridium fermenticellae]AYD39317.1 cyclic lactone autoinducer peptide [Clostridium fermenticellae]